jgi:hypothetical protein
VARGQTLQDDPLPDHAGRVGGEGTGDSTIGGVLQHLGGRVGRSQRILLSNHFFPGSNGNLKINFRSLFFFLVALTEP